MESLLCQLADNLPAPIAVLDRRGVFRYTNQRTRTFYGYQNGAALDFSIETFTPRKIDAERQIRYLASAIEQGREGKMVAQHRALNREDVFYVEITWTVVDFEGDRCALCLLRDCTAEKQLEASLLDELANKNRMSEVLEASVSAADEAQRRQQTLQAVISAQEDERRRIAQEIHDWIATGLVGPSYQIQTAKQLLSLDPDRAGRILDEAVEAISSAHEELRRIMHDLHPYLLDQMGLADAIRAYLDRFRSWTGLRVESSITVTREPDQNQSLAVYRLLQEALNNVAVHAEASKVDVLLDVRPKSLHLHIADDGKGFDPKSIDRANHMGINSMRERVASYGGKLNIKSEPGLGTNVCIKMPLKEAEAGGRRQDAPGVG